MLLSFKLVDETQISKPSEPPRHQYSMKLWILLPLRADLLFTLQCEIPCNSILLCLFHELYFLFTYFFRLLNLGSPGFARN